MAMGKWCFKPKIINLKGLLVSATKSIGISVKFVFFILIGLFLSWIYTVVDVFIHNGDCKVLSCRLN